MTITLLSILISILVIGFMWGSFISLLVTILATTIWYITDIYISLLIILVLTICSGIYKYKRAKV